ncbi:MAG: hypothetical protein ABR587_15050 [Candidatus Binatia bacterium]
MDAIGKLPLDALVRVAQLVFHGFEPLDRRFEDVGHFAHASTKFAQAAMQFGGGGVAGRLSAAAIRPMAWRCGRILATAASVAGEFLDEAAGAIADFRKGFARPEFRSSAAESPEQAFGVSGRVIGGSAAVGHQTLGAQRRGQRRIASIRPLRAVAYSSPSVQAED